MEKLLIVDDELLMRDFLNEALKRKKFEVHLASDVLGALALLKHHHFDIVITDMNMPDGTGLDVLKKIKDVSPNTLTLVITAFASVENAVEAMRLGAFNYLIKPFSVDNIEAMITKAREHLYLVAENTYLKKQVSSNMIPTQKHTCIVHSPIMKNIFSNVKRFAKSSANIFISGESGTGKEVIAQAIHNHSQRKNKNYVKVNCAAIPETLIESEFFGFEKGAFTGAQNKRQGRFELANGGSLLLDEVTEIPIHLQAKLLRVIQEKEFERLGSSKPIQTDIRIISTSNRIMDKAIEDKVFRADLFYRLNVIPIHLPPLRERIDDILPLAEFFIEKFAAENKFQIKQLTPCAKKALQAYPWPGNIRELSNIIERSMILHYDEKTLSEAHLDIQSDTSSIQQKNLPSLKGYTLKELEKKLIVETLNTLHFNKSKAAKNLGISVKTLRTKINDYNLS